MGTATPLRHPTKRVGFYDESFLFGFLLEIFLSVFFVYLNGEINKEKPRCQEDEICKKLQCTCWLYTVFPIEENGNVVTPQYLTGLVPQPVRHSSLPL